MDINGLTADMHHAIEFAVERIIKNGAFEVDSQHIEVEDRHDPESAQVTLRRNDGSTVLLMDVGRSLELDFNGMSLQAEYAPTVVDASDQIIDSTPTAGLTMHQYLVLQRSNDIVRGNI